MKKVIIKNSKTNEELPYFTTQENPQDWINYIISSNICGLPERIVDDVEGNYDQDDVIEKFESIEKEATEDSPAIVKNKVKLKAEYTIEIIDITSEIEQQKINEESLKYLNDTDWYIIRELDSGISCPAEIKATRAAARAAIIK